MAYFSNSSEGYVLDELCLKCIHGYDVKKEENRNKNNMPCAAWLLQGMWNYEQHEREKKGKYVHKFGNVTVHKPIGVKTRNAQLKGQALDILFPQTDEVLCAMFKEIDASKT